MNGHTNKTVIFQQLDMIDYQEGWHYQEKLFAEVIAQKIANRKAEEHLQEPTPNYLLFCQHPHVFTLGKSGLPENLLLDENELKTKYISYYHINRGGDITYHGPGQIVGYPILDLDNFFTDIHKYLRYLEEAVIRTLADYHIEAGRIEGLTGVWVDHIHRKNPRKICAIGVKSSRWVTMHGFAFNVNTDLSYFDYIIPCGIADKAVTSLEQELDTPLPLPEVEDRLKVHLADLFEMELVEDNVQTAKQSL